MKQDSFQETGQIKQVLIEYAMGKIRHEKEVPNQIVAQIKWQL